MTIEIKYAFDNPVDYSYDAAKVEVTGGVSRLNLAANAGQTFDQDFLSDSGFTYDSNLAEFQGGQVQQVNQVPDNATFGAVWNQNINGNWGSAASLIPTSTKNNPQISGGKLDLVSDKNVIYNMTGAINPNIGAIKIKFTPNYNGTPSNSQQVFYYAESGSTRNRAYLEITTSGALRLYVFNEDGVSSGVSSFGNWTDAVQGQEYEIELNYDFTSGSEEQRLFINGIQKSATSNRVSNRSNNLARPIELRMGGAANSDYLLGELVAFDVVQHTGDYTPGYTLPEQPYLEVPIELPAFVYQGEGLIQVFESIAQTASAVSHWVINGKYFDGASWVISDSSYAQANDLATVNAHIGSLQVSNSIIVTLVLPGGDTQSYCSNFILTYTGQSYFTGSTIIPNAAVPASSLSGFIAEETDLAGTSIRYAIEVDTVLVWWDGANWVPSSGVAETNTAQEVNDNAASLTLSPSGSFVRPLIYFITDGTGTSELEAVTVAFVYDVNPIQAPSKTVVFGSLRDIIAEPFSSASLRVENAELFFKTGTAILPSKVVGNTNDQAVAYVELVRTGPNGYKYSFYIDYYDAEGSLKTISLGKSVAPDDEATNIATLTFE